MRLTAVLALAAAGAILTTTGCGIVGSGVSSAQVPDFPVTSPAFNDLNDLTARYVCGALKGSGKTPSLHWSASGLSDVNSFTIVVDDPDARGGTYIHWVLANLSSNTTDLVEGDWPKKAIVGRNSAGKAEYTPPCPPKGQRHRYRFTVYGLKEPVTFQTGAELKESLPQIASRTVAVGRITGYFGSTDSG